jgi:hypothetical protein
MILDYPMKFNLTFLEFLIFLLLYALLYLWHQYAVAGGVSIFVNGVDLVNSNPNLLMIALPVTNCSHCYPFALKLMLCPGLNAKALAAVLRSSIPMATLVSILSALTSLSLMPRFMPWLATVVVASRKFVTGNARPVVAVVPATIAHLSTGSKHLFLILPWL